jgi:hypothetical protein
MDDRFQVELLRRQERKIFSQIEPSLRSENCQCPSAGTIGPRSSLLENESQKIQVRPHQKFA